MPPKHGDLLTPKELQLGYWLQAKDTGGLWYNARVISKTGRAAATEVTVRFDGFSKRHNLTYVMKHQSLREKIPKTELKAEQDAHFHQGDDIGRHEDGTWDIEKVVKKRRGRNGIEYLVRWAGWSASWDTWERALPRNIIDEFVETNEALAELRLELLTEMGSTPLDIVWPDPSEWHGGLEKLFVRPHCKPLA